LNKAEWTSNPLSDAENAGTVAASIGKDPGNNSYDAGTYDDNVASFFCLCKCETDAVTIFANLFAGITLVHSVLIKLVRVRLGRLLGMLQIMMVKLVFLCWSF